MTAITYIGHGKLFNMVYMRYIDFMPKPPILTVKKLVALTPDMTRAIEDFRFTQRVGSESEAIRRLIELGLEAAKAEAPKAG